MLIDLDPVDRITAGAVGPPGRRVFYMQARQGSQLVTVVVEKQQVELLAASLVDLVARSGRETAEGPSGPEMDLEEPIAPEWRVGRLSVGYDEERDRIILEAEELADDDESAPELQRVRVAASREQALALARHGAAVCAAGRPTCQVCGNPIDPAGHNCPALNGHGELA